MHYQMVTLKKYTLLNTSSSLNNGLKQMLWALNAGLFRVQMFLQRT